MKNDEKKPTPPPVVDERWKEKLFFEMTDRRETIRAYVESKKR